jgi:hypothetical protein
MSDLSFLMLSQKEVKFDEIYFFKMHIIRNHNDKSLISNNNQYKVHKVQYWNEMKIYTNFY